LSIGVICSEMGWNAAMIHPVRKRTRDMFFTCQGCNKKSEFDPFETKKIQLGTTIHQWVYCKLCIPKIDRSIMVYSELLLGTVYRPHKQPEFIVKFRTSATVCVSVVISGVSFGVSSDGTFFVLLSVKDHANAGICVTWARFKEVVKVHNLGYVNTIGSNVCPLNALILPPHSFPLDDRPSDCRRFALIRAVLRGNLVTGTSISMKTDKPTHPVPKLFASPGYRCITSCSEPDCLGMIGANAFIVNIEPPMHAYPITKPDGIYDIVHCNSPSRAVTEFIYVDTCEQPPQPQFVRCIPPMDPSCIFG